MADHQKRLATDLRAVLDSDVPISPEEWAAAILVSDVIREVRHQERALGWDRCLADLRLFAGSSVTPVNPYRTEAITKALRGGS